jgi:hypothetical protein
MGDRAHIRNQERPEVSVSDTQDPGQALQEAFARADRPDVFIASGAFAASILLLVWVHACSGGAL